MTSKVEVQKEMKVKKKSKNSLRENNKQSFKDVIKILNIDETFTKSDTKQKKYNKFITAVVPEENFNYMSDLIELPTTSEKYKWLLVCMDLATNIFDIEAMKNKEAKTTLDAFKIIIKRGILKLPEISLKTDGGTEFKGQFNSYLLNHKIFHKTAMTYRKTQMGPVEGLNNTIARLLMNYLNDKSLEIGKDYLNWTDILPQIRVEVNHYRKRNIDKLKDYQDEHYFNVNVAGKPEYSIGDYVHWKVERPIDIHGKSLNDQKFRKGDRIYSLETRQIVDILCYSSTPYYRYKLKDMNNVSYSSYELKPSAKGDDYYRVRKIIGVKTMNKKKFYLVWWDKTLKKDATWVSGDQLVEDGLSDEIQAYEKQHMKQKKIIPKNKVAVVDDDYDEENPYWKPF